MATKHIRVLRFILSYYKCSTAPYESFPYGKPWDNYSVRQAKTSINKHLIDLIRKNKQGLIW